MNIAIFSRVLYLSGVTTHIIDLSKELIVRGHSVYIFTRGEEFPQKNENIQLTEKIRHIGAQIVKIPFGSNPNKKLLYAYDMIKSIFIVRAALIQYRIDIIHVHTPALSFMPVLLGRKYIKTIHLKNLRLSVLNRKATHEITISRETYQEAKNKFNYTDNQISLIYNGVDKRFSSHTDTTTKNNIKREFKLPQDKIIIGIIGTIQFRKGHDVLIKAIGFLPDILKDKIHLVIIGDGDYQGKKWLFSLINKFEIGSITSIFGFQDPKPFYDIIDILVLPSRLEGFPLVTIEAFLSGCCVVRSNVEGAYDQINHETNGFLFSSENDEELSAILTLLILDEKKRKDVAIEGRNYALDNFTSDIMVEKTLEVYRSIL